MADNIKIIGKYSLIKTFNSPEDFNKYYIKHKEEIDNKTSNQLNKEYKIDGYKITKRNITVIDGKKHGELLLKPKNNKQNDNKLNDNDIDDRINAIEHKLNDITTKITLLTESYNSIISLLNNV